MFWFQIWWVTPAWIPTKDIKRRFKNSYYSSPSFTIKKNLGTYPPRSLDCDAIFLCEFGLVACDQVQISWHQDVD